jgi:hypothetical protein
MKQRRLEAEINQLLCRLLMEVGKPLSPSEPERLMTMDDVRDMVARDYGHEVAARIQGTVH